MEPGFVRVLLIAGDFDRTCAFYRGVLGLPVDESWNKAAPDGRGMVFRCGGAVRRPPRLSRLRAGWHTAAAARGRGYP